MTKLRLLLFLITILSYCETTLGKLYINEFMFRNTSTLMDLTTYNYCSWIEFFNTDNKDIDLRAYYFSDDPHNLKKYIISKSCVVPANGFGVLWLNGNVNNARKDDFKGNADGGTMFFSDRSGNLIEEIEYPKQIKEASFGRKTDLSDNWTYFVNHTQGVTNNEAIAATEQTDAPVFSIIGGWYKSAVTVSLSSETVQSRIYYTLDGSEPTDTSIPYSGIPIVISKTTPLRAIAYAQGEIKSLITTARI